MTAKRGLDCICTTDTPDHPDTIRRLDRKNRYADARLSGAANDEAVRQTAYKLAPTADEITLTRVSSFKKPYCDNPVPLTRRTKGKADRRTMLVEQFVPCRKCAKCLQYRQMKWRQRALVEMAYAHRTWFVTLTFDPVHLAGVLAESARLRPRLDRRAA